MPYAHPPSGDELRRAADQARVRVIANGYDGTRAILRDMSRLTLAALEDERIHQLARQITMSCAPRAGLCELERIFTWMQASFRYTRLPWHPAGLQRVQAPAYTLLDAPTRTGECASLSCALAALCMAMGLECRFRSAGSDPTDPRFFEHVYVLVHVPDHGWVLADPSYPEPLGWEHAEAHVVEDWEIR